MMKTIMLGVCKQIHMDSCRCRFILGVLLVSLSGFIFSQKVFGKQNCMGDTIPSSLGRPIVISSHDSVISKKLPDSIQVKTVPRAATEFRPSSKKALLYSIIPGGGQIYNRQYWKIPIIVGAYTACFYAINWNQGNLTEYANAYREVKSENPLEFNTWKDFVPYGTDPEKYISNDANRNNLSDRLKRGRDFFRRNRDLSIIISVAVYAIVMVDAYVDAELFNFDISQDLSMKMTPSLQMTPMDTRHPYYGLSLAFTF